VVVSSGEIIGKALEIPQSHEFKLAGITNKDVLSKHDPHRNRET
jgi:hypothetical protein